VQNLRGHETDGSRNLKVRF